MAFASSRSDAAPRVELSVLSDRHVALTADGGATANLSIPEDAPGRPDCDALGPDRLNLGVASIVASTETRYDDFLRAANWLQDCGVYDLRLSLRSDDSATPPPATPAAPLEVRQQPDSLPQPDRLSRYSSPCRPPTSDVTIPCVAFVALTAKGDIWVIVGDHRAHRSSLEALAGDARYALATPRLRNHRLYVRADPAVHFGRYIDVLARLRAAGITDVGVISEEV